MGVGLSRLNPVLVVLVSALLVRSVIPPHRKTFGFGPVIPHALFESVPVDPTGDSKDANGMKDAYAVAHDFLSRRYDDPHTGRTYVFRPDSYLDDTTGVTHVYARQVVGGLEVANAHVNLNVKDGRVLSFGDSFFPGPGPLVARRSPKGAHVIHVHKKRYCAQLSSALGVQRSFLHLPLAADDRTRVARGLADLERIHDSSCVLGAIDSSSPSSSSPKFVRPTEIDVDPRRALLAFLAFALPEEHPEYDSVQDRGGDSDDLERHMSNIVMTPEIHMLSEEHAFVGMSLSNVPGAVGEVKSRVAWMQVPTRRGVQLTLVHRFEVEMEQNWYEATVSVSTPHRILSVADWVNDSPIPKAVAREDVPQAPEWNDASYLVFPWGTNDPVDAAQRKASKSGEPVEAEYPLSYGREVVKELGDTLASPLGWHTLPFSHDPSIGEEDKIALGQSYWRTTNTTWGNNVFAQENWECGQAWIYNQRPIVYTDRTFSYPYSSEGAGNPAKSVEQAKAYVNASVTQLFYTANMVHDLFYRYGFTEAAGNFQQYNFGKGGEEGDAVIIDAQCGLGFNNAAFASPPDGQNGRCRILLWDTGSPYVDGAMEADVVIHEVSHGLSMRLTGGPKNSGCLGWEEPRGMGEGWGDFIAITVRSTHTYSDYTLGAWASNREGGVRNYPYSTRPSVNPLTYESLDRPEFSGLHAIGEVWAEMLWIVQQRLIAKYGFSDTLFPPIPNTDGSLPSSDDFYRPRNPGLVPKHGNTLMLQLVVNGMKMQPCSPSFFNARDAIIEADRVLTDGENVCDIWAGFAERGLGVDAEIVGSEEGKTGARKNGFDVPAECRSKVSVGRVSEIRARFENVIMPPPPMITAPAEGGGKNVDPPKVTTVLFADPPYLY